MSDIRGAVANITKNVTKASSDFIKTTKLNISLSSEENALKELYIEIGKKVHEIYQYGGALGKYFDEKYLEIEDKERKIDKIKEQIRVIKGTRPPEKPPPEPPPVPPPKSPVPPATTQGVKKCRICGSENEAGVKFCLSCGRIVD